MSTTQIFEVTFQIVGPAGSGAGNADKYRRPEIRKATVAAASAHPKDILSVLNADVTIPAGDHIDILSVRPGHVIGTEGGAVLS